MRISDWSSDVCSSDLNAVRVVRLDQEGRRAGPRSGIEGGVVRPAVVVPGRQVPRSAQGNHQAAVRAVAGQFGGAGMDVVVSGGKGRSPAGTDRGGGFRFGPFRMKAEIA